MQSKRHIVLCLSSGKSLSAGPGDHVGSDPGAGRRCLPGRGDLFAGGNGAGVVYRPAGPDGAGSSLGHADRRTSYQAGIFVAGGTFSRTGGISGRFGWLGWLLRGTAAGFYRLVLQGSVRERGQSKGGLSDRPERAEDLPGAGRRRAFCPCRGQALSSRLESLHRDPVLPQCLQLLFLQFRIDPCL